MNQKRIQEPQRTSSKISEIPLDVIKEAVESIRHGTVQLIIQDGRVIQIDKTEKLRLA